MHFVKTSSTCVRVHVTYTPIRKRPQVTYEMENTTNKRKYNWDTKIFRVAIQAMGFQL